MNHTIAAFLFGCFLMDQFFSPQDYDSIINRIIKALESKDVQARRDVVGSLQFHFRLGGAAPMKAIPALLKALNDPDAEVRQGVANLFAHFGKDSKPAIPLLADLLRDKEVNVRRAAAGTLLELGPLSKEVAPALHQAKKDCDKLVRIYAGTAVAGLEHEDEKALRFLLEFSTDKDEDAQGEAASAFVYIGVRAIPMLKDGLKDKNPVVRDWTIGAMIAVMRKISERARFPADVIPLLTNAINDENAAVACSAIYAVSQLGFRAKEAIPAIVKRFKDPDWQVRQYAIDHVQEFGPASELAIPALKAALKDEHASVRDAAKLALAAIKKAKKAKAP